MGRQIDIKNSFEHSDALSRYIERRVTAALRSQQENIKNIVLKVFDANGPRGGSNDKVARISVSVKPWGRLVASAASSDIYVSVDQAAARLEETLRRHRSRLKTCQRGAIVGLQRHAD